jgi:uncharacterized spore protein YtfJ
MGRTGPVAVETVRGRPVEVYGRTLVPVARVVSTRGRQGTIRQARVEGSGWGTALVRPVEVIEESAEGVRVLPIYDQTRAVLRQMALVGAAIPLLAVALVLFNRWMRDR